MAAKPKPRMIGRHIVADPAVCHGQPTFRGIRILVSDVLEQVSSGMAWAGFQRLRNDVLASVILECLACQTNGLGDGLLQLQRP